MIEQLEKRLKAKTVILCIGNRMRGDDGAGPALSEKIEGKVKANIINCEETPENYTGKIKELTPDTVIMVDAVDMGAEPGSMSIIERQKLNDLALYTTHNIPLKVLADYLFIETKADIFLIGIQPESINNGQISPKVEKTLDYLKDILIEILG